MIERSPLKCYLHLQQSWLDYVNLKSKYYSVVLGTSYSADLMHNLKRYLYNCYIQILPIKTAQHSAVNHCTHTT